MTKPVKTGATAWKTKWPRNGDLDAWFRCMLSKCDAIADDEQAADKAHLPIESLAERGHVDEALKYVDRFLRRLPRQSVLPTVRLAEVGAEVALNAGNLPLMEKYLAIAATTEEFNTRKCDQGFSINSVREFRARHGLLDPGEAVGDEERIEAGFRRAQRDFNAAMASRKRKAAQTAVVHMEAAAWESEGWSRQQYLREVIDCHARLGDSTAVERCLRRLDKDDREEILDTDTLMKLGLKARAIARAKREVRQELETLGGMTDPNIHFPVMAICRALKFLVSQGEREAARRWLRRALREMPTWPVIEQGWTTSAVYTEFAEAAAAVGDCKTADALVNDALADGKAEKRSGFRRGATSAALEAKANLGHIDEAIAAARKIRPPAGRRVELAKLLARAGRWKELREVLVQVASTEEAADICWSIKFELPGGEPM